MTIFPPTGKNSNRVPLLEATEASIGIKTAFLFNPINTPAPLQKVPVSHYNIPSDMTLTQFANLAIQAPNTPFLLLIDDNAPLVSEIKSLYQTFKIGSIEVTEDSVNVIPQFPGYDQPQTSVPSHFPVPSGSSFPTPSVASTAPVSQVASSSTPQNPNLNQAVPSSLSDSSAISHGLNINSNQATSSSAS